MRIGTRLVLSFTAIAALTLIVGGVGTWGVNRVTQHLKGVNDLRLPAIDNLRAIAGSFESLRVAQRTLLSPRLDAAGRARQWNNIQKAREACQQHGDAFGSLPKTPKEAEQWASFQTAVAEWQQSNDRFFAMAKELEAKAIIDPVSLERDLEQFRGDHYKLVVDVADSIRSGKALDRGHDAGACNLGRWLGNDANRHMIAANPTLRDAVEEIHKTHHVFHGFVAVISGLMHKGQADEAQRLMEGKMAVAMQGTFSHLQELRAEAGRASRLYDELGSLALETCVQKQRVALGLLGKIIDENQRLATDTGSQANTDSRLASYLAILGMAIGAVIALGFGLMLSRGITRALTGIVAELSSCAKETASASQQVAGEAQTLANGTSETAAALEETSASLEEINSLVQQSADSSATVNKVSRQACQTGERGAGAIGELAKAIAEIKANADQTARIVRTIDEIAFQTNLLSLNAAVEAARAGEAGKSFVVVAEEVRKLSLRATEAAQNTSQLIEQSMKSAERGVSLSQNVTSVVGEMTDANRKVNELAGNVAASTREIAAGIGQIAKAVRQMDQVTQGNAASAEENSSVGEEMSAQAQSLTQLINRLESMVRATEAASPSRAVPASRPTAKPATPYQAPIPAEDMAV